ncbi:bacteriophage spanin2 family protein [Saccharothrix syringae]|uniref:bacteriophage spanin2 family protein n=1 Tax=Saccharothrix syringae TaxID=103733 RepID=UPI000524337B|nr:bacteriophage spanin2 family protein [Saccharothrix syringae]
MRSATRLAAVATALAAVTALSACGTLQDAADTANAVADTASTVQVCTEALAQVSAVPFDTSTPERAVDEAHDAASKLGDLAANAADTTVNEAITALAATMRDVTLQDLVSSPAEWLAAQANQVATLTAACTN